MKKLQIILLLPFLLESCGTKVPEADAYGNFESTPMYITPEVGGKILEVMVDEGDKIQAGQTVAVVDSTELLLKLQQLMHQKEAVIAGLNSTTAQAAVFDQQIASLETDRKRLENLLAGGSVTQKQYDDVVAAITLAQKQKNALLRQNDRIGAEIKALESQIDLMQLNIGRCKVKAMEAGQVLNIYQHKGELAVPGKPLLRMAHTDTLYLRAFASGDQLPLIQAGMGVTVRVDAGKGGLQTLRGIITWISTEAEFTPKVIQTRRERVNLVYAFKVKVANDGSLNIGMPGEVIFEAQP